MFARSFLVFAAAAAAFAHPAPARAQSQSDSYKFLQAVRDSKGEDVEKLLNIPGTTVIDTRTRDTSEGALHIVVKRGDATYLNYLLSRHADPNLRDGNGNTPLMAAVTAGYPGMIDILVKAHADINLANRAGETPLIMAVHRRDLDTIRILIAAGADPDQRDHLGGLSARDYAHQDTRGTAMAKLIDETPKKTRAPVSGPKL